METVLQNWSDADLLLGEDKIGELGIHELVERYKNSLYSFLRQFLTQHDLVEDAVQVTFTKVYACRDTGHSPGYCQEQTAQCRGLFHQRLARLSCLTGRT